MVYILQKLKEIIEDFLPSEILEQNNNANPTLVEMVNIAKEEWLEARKFYEEVTDPILIDHAIYRIKSAEKKYMYLLKLANEEKIKNTKISIH